MRYFQYFAMVLTCTCFFSMLGEVSAQPASQPTSATAPQPMRPRIALVNMTKVLREFKKANEDGKVIGTQSQYYAEKIRALRIAQDDVRKSLQMANTISDKETYQKKYIAMQRQIEDIDRQGKNSVGELSEKIVLEVYQNVKTTITDIAVANNFDLVMVYPDISAADDEKKPEIARMKLSTPALLPYYHRNMDITEYVIKTLNMRYPVSQSSTPAPSNPPQGSGPKQ